MKEAADMLCKMRLVPKMEVMQSGRQHKQAGHTMYAMHLPLIFAH